MKIEILGSGGAVTTPQPFCECLSCQNARNDISQCRYGPSVFIHGPDILLDTPEEIFVELNRSTVKNIKACLYSHWHPDHTSGRRIFEINTDWYGKIVKNKTTAVILPVKVKETFNEYLGLMTHLKVLESRKLIEIIEIPNKGTYRIDNYTIEPIQLSLNYSFGYIIEDPKTKILIIMDELKNWLPSKELLDIEFDLIYLPFGVFIDNPISHTIKVDINDSLLECEQTNVETLEIVKKMNSKKFILSHIEEPDDITLDLGKKLSEYYSGKYNKDIELAHDSMMIDISES